MALHTFSLIWQKAISRRTESLYRCPWPCTLNDPDWNRGCELEAILLRIFVAGKVCKLFELVIFVSYVWDNLTKCPRLSKSGPTWTSWWAQGVMVSRTKLQTNMFQMCNKRTERRRLTEWVKIKSTNVHENHHHENQLETWNRSSQSDGCSGVLLKSSWLKCSLIVFFDRKM